MAVGFDLDLDEMLDKIKTQMWIEEELQIQPEDKRKVIYKSFKDLYGNSLMR